MKTDFVVVDELAPANVADVKWFDVASDVSIEFQHKPDSVSVSIGYAGPFPVCPEEEVATHLEWDLFYPSGLVSVVPDDKPYDVVLIGGSGVGGRGSSKTIGVILGSMAAAGIRALVVSPEQFEELQGIGMPPDAMVIAREFPQFVEPRVNPVNSLGGSVSPRSRAGKAMRWR
jgi:hypothetical protein